MKSSHLSTINYQLSTLIYQNFMEKKSKSVWSVILKVVVTVVTALAGVFGITSCTH